MGLKSFFERIGREKRGSAMVIAAFGMPVVIGAAGLAVDTVQWSLMKRQMQRAADSSALAGAYAVGQGKSADTSARADLLKFADVAFTSTPVVENAPTSGPYAGNNRAVRVILKSSSALPFSRLFLSSPPLLTAEATASIIINGLHCLISLESGTEPGIVMAGNATAQLGCGVATNSRARNAIQAGGSSVLRASPVTAVGGILPSSSFVGGAKLEAYSLAQPDPFKDLPDPVLPATCNNRLNVGTQDVVSITADPNNGTCYRGMDIKGTLNLGPGVYYMDGSSLDLGSQAKLTGTGVTIILTSATAATQPSTVARFEGNGGAAMNLSAPTSGTYKGVLIYQDRRASAATNHVNGNADSVLTGALYFPKQDLFFNGTAGMQTNCIQIVSRRITMSGNSTITNTCPPGSQLPEAPGARVRLVG